jgi:hypothetical protein
MMNGSNARKDFHERLLKIEMDRRWCDGFF